MHDIFGWRHPVCHVTRNLYGGKPLYKRCCRVDWNFTCSPVPRTRSRVGRNQSQGNRKTFTKFKDETVRTGISADTKEGHPRRFCGRKGSAYPYLMLHHFQTCWTLRISQAWKKFRPTWPERSRKPNITAEINYVIIRREELFIWHCTVKLNRFLVHSCTDFMSFNGIIHPFNVFQSRGGTPEINSKS